MTIALTVQPRVQREKWSLYWKESMMTKTDILDPVVLNVDEKKTKVREERRSLARGSGRRLTPRPPDSPARALPLRVDARENERMTSLR